MSRLTSWAWTLAELETAMTRPATSTTRFMALTPRSVMIAVPRLRTTVRPGETDLNSETRNAPADEIRPRRLCLATMPLRTVRELEQLPPRLRRRLGVAAR